MVGDIEESVNASTRQRIWKIQVDSVIRRVHVHGRED